MAEENDMDDGLLSPAELREAEVEADRILAQPAKSYEYRTEYKGGPRRLDSDTLVAAAVELATCRQVVEEIEDRLNEAKVMLYERVEEMVELGIPVEFVAEHSGLKHRSSVYRAIKQLPGLQAGSRRVQELRAALRSQT